MKLRFEPDLDYQQDAIAAVCDLFQGQETCRTEFTVSHGLDGQLPGFQEGELGVGNRLRLEPRELLDNLRQVQLRNGLYPAEHLQGTSQNPAQVSGPFRNSLNLMSQRDHDGNLKAISRSPLTKNNATQ